MRILVYDVAASNRGALSILTDFYQQVRQYGKDAEWYFVVSTTFSVDQKKPDKQSVF